jgi:hypothetical protein
VSGASRGAGLFGGPYLSEVAAGRYAHALATVERIPAARLLADDMEDLVDEVLEHLRWERVVVLWDKVVIDRPIRTGVVGRDIIGRTVMQPVIQIAFHVPFDGDPELLSYRASTSPLAPLEGTVTNGTLTFIWMGHVDGPKTLVHSWWKARRKEVQRFVDLANADLPPLNISLESSVRRAIRRRRGEAL